MLNHRTPTEPTLSPLAICLPPPSSLISFTRLNRLAACLSLPPSSCSSSTHLNLFAARPCTGIVSQLFCTPPSSPSSPIHLHRSRAPSVHTPRSRPTPTTAHVAIYSSHHQWHYHDHLLPSRHSPNSARTAVFRQSSSLQTSIRR